MDHTTIDHIMSAVNDMNGNNEDMAYFTGVLPHRSPATKNTNESFLSQSNNRVENTRNNMHNHNKINHPVDPVKSISSNDNYSNSSNDNDFFEMTQPTQRSFSKNNDNTKLQPTSHSKSHSKSHSTSRPVQQSTQQTTNNFNTHNARGRNIAKVDVDNTSDISNISNGVETETNNNAPTDNNGSTNSNDTQQPTHLTNLFGYNIPTSTLYFIIVLVLIAVGLFFLTAEKKKPIKHDLDKKRKDDAE